MRRIAPLLVLLVLLACPATALASGLTTGIVDPLSLGTGSPNIAGAADDAYSVGARTVRIELTWRVAEPTRGNFYWAPFDNLIRNARQHHLEPLVFLVNAPAWARGRGWESWMPDSTHPDPKLLGQFAKAAALHYNGTGPDPLLKVRLWQVWNEPNGNHWLTPQYKGGRAYSPRYYRSMVNKFATAVHSVNRRNRVLAGGTQPRGGSTNIISPLSFMRQVLCLTSRLKPACRGKIQIDAWSTHPYTWGAPTRHADGKNNVSIGDLPQMRRVLRAAIRYGHIVKRSGRAKRNVQFWVTEISWDTNPPDPDAPSARLQARWISLGLYRMWRAGVSRVYWFIVRDQPLNTCLWQSGFYMVGHVPKEDSIKAFRFPFVAFAKRGRVSVWGRIPPGVSTRRVAIDRHTASGWKRVARARERHGLFGARWRSGMRHGALRARVGPEVSQPFALRRRESRKSFYPFGSGSMNCFIP